MTKRIPTQTPSLFGTYMCILVVNFNRLSFLEMTKVTTLK